MFALLTVPGGLVLSDATLTWVVTVQEMAHTRNGQCARTAVGTDYSMTPVSPNSASARTASSCSSYLVTTAPG